MSQEKEFCIFIAKIITEEQLNDLKNFNKNLNDKSIYIKQEMRENNPIDEKLNQLGLPKNIKTGFENNESLKKKKYRNDTRRI